MLLPFLFYHSSFKGSMRSIFLTLLLKSVIFLAKVIFGFLLFMPVHTFKGYSRIQYFFTKIPQYFTLLLKRKLPVM